MSQEKKGGEGIKKAGLIWVHLSFQEDIFDQLCKVNALLVVR